MVFYINYEGGGYCDVIQDLISAFLKARVWPRHLHMKPTVRTHLGGDIALQLFVIVLKSKEQFLIISCSNDNNGA